MLVKMRDDTLNPSLTTQILSEIFSEWGIIKPAGASNLYYLFSSSTLYTRIHDDQLYLFTSLAPDNINITLHICDPDLKTKVNQFMSAAGYSFPSRFPWDKNK